jgi:adenylyltransferase/sulfurtransferase
MFPDTAWSAWPTEIADVGCQAIAATDVLFCCVDTDLARFEVAVLAKQLDVLVVDGGLGLHDYSFGRVSIFPACRTAACYGCLLSPRRRREILETWHATVRSCMDAAPEHVSSASTPTMAAVVAAMQVELGLRRFRESTESGAGKATSVEVRLHPQRRIEEYATGVSVDCPIHDDPVGAFHPMPGPRATFGDLLENAGAQAVVLTWPICLKARCLSCAGEWTPNVRLAALRRRGRCPQCQSTAILELETLRVIACGSEWAHATPADLGMPADHLYLLRVEDGRP